MDFLDYHHLQFRFHHHFQQLFVVCRVFLSCSIQILSGTVMNKKKSISNILIKMSFLVLLFIKMILTFIAYLLTTRTILLDKKNNDSLIHVLLSVSSQHLICVGTIFHTWFVCFFTEPANRQLENK